MTQTIPPLPETGYVRLPQIIGDRNATPPIPPIIPVSKSTWWDGVRSGRYPAPVRTLGRRITAWRVEDIRAFINASAKEAQK
jgi:predicted DNA-binding transcriptional regulator AlpA